MAVSNLSISRAQSVWPFILLIVQVALALYTLLLVWSWTEQQSYREFRCSEHHLDCTNPAVTVAVWIGLGGSAVLLLVSAVTVFRRSRRALAVAAMCCAAQVLVVLTTYVVPLR
jgi:cell division protein FtsW (lipid II flippase)